MTRVFLAALLYVCAQPLFSQDWEQERFWHRIMTDAMMRQASEQTEQAAARARNEYQRQQYGERVWNVLNAAMQLWNDHAADRIDQRNMEALDRAVERLQKTEGYRQPKKK